MTEKVTFFVRCLYARHIADDEALCNTEGSRFSEMIGTIVAAGVPFSQIAGEPWRIRRSASGVSALLPVEMTAGDVGRFARALKQCVASPGLKNLSVEILRGPNREQAQRLLLG